MPPNPIFIAADRHDHSPIELKLNSLLRHCMALGSSGSGKTVLCKALVEEVARAGVPALCLDPQGDLCSLSMAVSDPAALAAKGVDPLLAQQFAQQADVVVFTPAARKGVGLSADPIRIDPARLDARERVHAFTATATMLVSLLGYDLGGDDGEGLVAVFDKSLHVLFERATFPANLAAFSDYWLQLDETDKALYERYLNARKIEQACRKLARLDVGARRLLFHEGIPLEMDLLLGRGRWAVAGKTRISVIYLNTLHSQEDKEYFVAALTQQLYAWMLDNPSQQPQALFYIDEVAPFIPPVRKPACKDGLTLLFKQARKYGVCCLMATQNPGDVDYRAMAQFGTWALGRLTTRQDLQKVQPTVKSLDPVHADAVMEQLPGQKPGEFLLISPDNFARTRPINARWLYTEHVTLDEDAIERLTDARWRQRFALPVPQAETPARQSAAIAAPEQTTTVATPAPERSPAPEVSPDTPSQAYHDVLRSAASMSVREFAKLAKVSESKARSTLKTLVDEGLASAFKQGRGQRYWSHHNGLRPDIGLTAQVKAMTAQVSAEEAERIGYQLRETKLLGMLGDEEELASTKLEYRALFRLRFQEKIRRSFWQRLLSRTDFEQRAESVYLHTRTLQLVVFDPRAGMFLHERPEDLASDIEDFDGVAEFEQRWPGELTIDEHEWRERRDEKEAIAHFRDLYHARPKGIEAVFVPLWRIHLRRPGRPGARILTLDALSGRAVDW